MGTSGPLPLIPGMDTAGVVEEVGDGVKGFKVSEFQLSPWNFIPFFCSEIQMYSLNEFHGVWDKLALSFVLYHFSQYNVSNFFSIFSVSLFLSIFSISLFLSLFLFFYFSLIHIETFSFPP